MIDTRYWRGWLADEATARAFEDPQPGDRFHEMFSWWVYVVAVIDDLVITHEFAGHPSEYTHQVVHVDHRRYTRARFWGAFRYGSIPGWSMRYCDRDGPRLEVMS